jgi:hypothetical protein
MMQADYHRQMNQQNYEEWVKEKLVPSLIPVPYTTVILDDTPYKT